MYIDMEQNFIFFHAHKRRLHMGGSLDEKQGLFLWVVEPSNFLKENTAPSLTISCRAWVPHLLTRTKNCVHVQGRIILNKHGHV